MASRATTKRWVRWLLLGTLALGAVGSGCVYRGCVADAALDDTQRRLVRQLHTVQAGDVVLHPFTARGKGLYRLLAVQESDAPFTGALAVVPTHLDPQRAWTPQAIAMAWPQAKLVWREFRTRHQDEWSDSATALTLNPHDTAQPMTAWYAQTEGAGEVELLLDESRLTPALRRDLEDRRMWGWLLGGVLLFTCLMVSLWTLAMWSEAV